MGKTPCGLKDRISSLLIVVIMVIKKALSIRQKLVARVKSTNNLILASSPKNIHFLVCQQDLTVEDFDMKPYRKFQLYDLWITGINLLSHPFRGTGGRVKRTPALRGRRCNAVDENLLHH